MSAIEKLYAAYRSGCLKEDRLSTYYPFCASLIFEKNWETVDEDLVREEFEKKYGFSLPAPFVRQVLGTGVNNGSIVIKQGLYTVDRIKMREHCIQTKEFDTKWQKLIADFRHFCKKNDFSLDCFDVEKEILKVIDQNDEDIILGNGIIVKAESAKLTYIWGSYIDGLSELNAQQFEFYVAISLSNIFKQAIF